jgi:hypothetical protein
LHNVTINDPDLLGLTVPSTLTVGQSVTLFASKVWAGGAPATHVNTVTVNGVGDSSNQSVTAADSATVNIVPISVNCTIALFSASDFDNNPNDGHLTIDSSFAGTTLSGGFRLTINNPSTVNLLVTVTATAGELSTANCFITDSTFAPSAVPFTGTVAIPAGGSAYILCDLVLGANVCPGASIQVTVSGTATATDSLCLFDSTGNAVRTADSTCPASVNCVTPTTCRTTGGGDLYDGDQNQSCVLSTTTLFPLWSGAVGTSLPLNHVSHGGQLGAPFSHEDCAALLADPCIRGQWQHNRHYVGKSNPRLVFDADFHSATPKGLFDTLLCECLGCCPNPDGNTKKGPNGNFNGWNHLKFDVCNQEDHRVCGPVPRPAPANALIWSGLGTVKTVTDTDPGKVSYWVVLRVYIEDRSEPGGFHPKGSVDPADIYSFQAWTTGIPVATGNGKKNADPNDPTLVGAAGSALAGVNISAFRTALSTDSCNFISSIGIDGVCAAGTLPLPTVAGAAASVNDSGPLRNGNRQIHPATDATCTTVGGAAPVPGLTPNPYCTD